MAASLCCISASAQQLQPRIVGLENNEDYMKLLHEDHTISQHEDSITVVVESLREAYRNNPEGSADSREQIISLENSLFELRTRKAQVVDSLNAIEQGWVLNNFSESKPPAEREQTQLIASTSGDDVKYIYESPNVRANLSSIDFKNLVKAEEAEAEAEALSNSFTVNYDNMLSLSRSYEATSSQAEAEDIMDRFNSLSRANDKILSQLSNTWGFIYDNKSFAYSILMELLGFTDVLQQEAELMRKAQGEISAKQGGGCSDEQMRYLVQKSSMIEFEVLVAKRLELHNLATSIDAVGKKLRAMEKESMPKLTLEERQFIIYEPIEFVTKSIYTASNPIPQTEIYERGTIFRIYVGSFATKQSVSTFRNTVPLSCTINSEKRYCYYIGGFESFEEAEQAQAELKKHGFRAPQIVVWQDGREHNLTKEPLEISVSYRINVDNAPILPTGASEQLHAIAPSAIISKVGTDKFVITSLTRRSEVTALVAALSEIDPQMVVSVEKSEKKLEF
ncbi:MAG: SPOR domain-containing protein [Rikenellaceae bacterium]